MTQQPSSSTVEKILSILCRIETPQQKLWREVYVASIKSGGGTGTATFAADRAVQAFRERNV